MSIARPAVDSPDRIAVTVWGHPGGGYAIWLEAIVGWSDGDTLDRADPWLAREVRRLAEQGSGRLDTPRS